MARNILILTGSPRKRGNSDLMADAFADGAREAGHQVVKFETAFKKIGGCRACEKCWSSGEPCIFPDDFRALAPLLEAADTVVLATPLYYFSFSAQIHAAINRSYCYIVPACERPLRIKDSFLLTCAEMPDPWIFDGIVKSYENIARFLGWQDRGQVHAYSVQKVGDIKGTEYLEQAYQLGRSLE